MSPTDILFFHSTGGDLGGARTGPLALASLNNLFDTVSRKQTEQNDYVDYRCFYVFNSHATDALFDTRLYILSERKGGSYIDLGIPLQNEQQQLLFVGEPWEDDDITLSVDGNNVVIDYYRNVTQWQGDIQTKLRGLDNLQDVIVGVVGEVPNVTFTINFVGGACCRDFPTITQVSSTLHGTTLTVVDLQDGSPINTTAQTIPSKLHRPTGIDFAYPLAGSPVRLGNLRAQEGFPVWVRRTTPQGTTLGIEDNFVLRVDGASV